MSDVVHTAAQEPIPASNGDTPTITHFQQLAANLKTAIAAVMAEVPKFEIPNGENTKFVRAHQSVPPEFVVSVITQLDPSEAGFNVLDPADVQNVLQFVEAFRPLVNDAEALSKGLDYTVKAQYARIAATSLDAYAIATRLARNGNGAMTLKVQNMRRALGRRAKKSAPPTAPGSACDAIASLKERKAIGSFH
jgi:hypothetical protein